MNEPLRSYIEETILPMYDCFDAAHRRDHVDMVIEQSMDIARRIGTSNEYQQASPESPGEALFSIEPLNLDMVYAIAAYHDTGLVKDRKTHHIESGRIVRNDKNLTRWFTADQIEVMAQAVEDHRASSAHEPRSIYGRIVAEADRFINPDKIIERTIQYGLDNYPQLDKEGHYNRTLAHLHEKYAEGGYLKLWFDESPNKPRLEALRDVIRNEKTLQIKFESIFNRLTNG